MKREKLIENCTEAGLSYNEKINFEDDIQNDIVVFDSCNGYRFRIDSKWG